MDRALLIRRTLQVTSSTLAGLAVVAVVYLGIPGLPGTPSPASGPVLPAALDATPGVLELDPFPAPAFSVVTSEGEPFTEARLQGRVSLVFFGFANCPDVCPLTLGKMSRALEILSERHGPQARFQGIFVSVDPERDTPEALERYMARFDGSLTALTGDESHLHQVAEAWGVHVAILRGVSDPHAGHGTQPGGGAHDGHDGAAAGAPGAAGALPPESAEVGSPSGAPRGDPTDPSDYAVEHSTRSFVVDVRGRVVQALAAYLTAEEMADALEPHLATAGLLDPSDDDVTRP